MLPNLSTIVLKVSKTRMMSAPFMKPVVLPAETREIALPYELVGTPGHAVEDIREKPHDLLHATVGELGSYEPGKLVCPARRRTGGGRTPDRS